MSNVGKKHLKIQGWLNVPKGQRFAKGTLRSQVGKKYIKVQGLQKVPKGPRFARGSKGLMLAKCT